MTKYLRVDCASLVDGKMVQSMTGIHIEINDLDDFETAKAKALGFIVSELSRYGLHEALGSVGLKPEPTETSRASHYS